METLFTMNTLVQVVYFVVAILFILGPGMGVINIHFSIMAFILFVISGMIFVGVALATTPPPAEQVSDMTWQEREIEEVDMPWYKDYKVHAAVITVVTLIIVVSFW